MRWFVVCLVCLAGPGMLLGADSVGAQEAPAGPLQTFITHCYDAIRLHRRPVEPSTDPGWKTVNEATREALGIAPLEKAYIRAEPADDLMVLHMREKVLAEAKGPDKFETRQSCRLLYTGEESSREIYDGLSDLFGLEGFDDRSVLRRCGYDLPEGWTHWVWSATPGRNDRQWRMYEDSRRRHRSACVFATTDRYYTATDLVHVRFLVRESEPEISIIELHRTFRPERTAPAREPKVDVMEFDPRQEPASRQRRRERG